MTENQFQSRTAPGVSLAAVVSAAAGILTLSLLMLVARNTLEARVRIYEIGEAMVPWADRFGSLAGAELLAGFVWLVAWVLLARRWRGGEIEVRPAFAFIFAAILVATLFAWL